MSQDFWAKILTKLEEHDYMQGVHRTELRVKATAEIFTPSPLVIEIMQYLDLNLFLPGRTVLDPACGDGQFLVAAKWIKIYKHKMTERDALADLYGVDIMRDNVELCKLRLGGGTVLLGNTLKPQVRLKGQTKTEHQEMIRIFGLGSFSGKKEFGLLSGGKPNPDFLF